MVVGTGMYYMKIKQKLQHIFIYTIILVTLFTGMEVQAHEVTSDNPDALLQYIEEIINWKKNKENISANESLLNHHFLENAGDSIVDWYVIGLGRSGAVDDYAAYLAVIEDIVEKRYKINELLSSAKATEWHRISLAILAAGGDPTKTGKDKHSKPIHLIADGTYNRGKNTRQLGTQGLNGWIWGLITLDSLRYSVPTGAYETRESILTEILQAQLEDGGFSLHYGQAADIDITAMAIQALAPYYNSEETFTFKQIATNKMRTTKVREVIEEALAMLSDAQLDDGNFSSWGMSNAESTAQVIVALTTLGIDPLQDERFIKNGHTLLDGLFTFRMEDGGFIHSKTFDADNPTSSPNESNDMASEQVLYTFIALYRHYERMRTLYDFRAELSPEMKEAIAKVEKSIAKIPKHPTQSDTGMIEQTMEAYTDIPIAERGYVRQYKELADAMEQIGIENQTEALSTHMGLQEEGNGTITSLFTKETSKLNDESITEKDINMIQKIMGEPVSTAYYVDVVTLLQKLSHPKYKEQYDTERSQLEVMRTEIEQVEEEITAINEEILNELYPFQQIRIEDKTTVDDIMKRHGQLSMYDQAKIQGYEDVEKAAVQINNLQRARYITIAIGSIILVMAGILYWRYRIRKATKRNQMIIEDDWE